MLPIAIKSDQTDSLDATWLYRLKNLDIDQFIFTLENVTNEKRLDYLSEQLGLPTGIFDLKKMTSDERTTLLKGFFVMKKKAGTQWSIIEMCKLLGAHDASISRKISLTYDGYAAYDGAFLYDLGSQAFQYTVFVTIQGVSVSEESTYDKKLRELFDIIQPGRLYLEEVSFM